MRRRWLWRDEACAVAFAASLTVLVLTGDWTWLASAALWAWLWLVEWRHTRRQRAKRLGTVRHRR